MCLYWGTWHSIIPGRIPTPWLFPFLLGKITLSREPWARCFPKTWSQSDSFIHQTLKIRLIFKNICYASFQYAFFFLSLFTTTFKNISLDSKDKICANIYLCTFPDGDAHLSSVQKHRFWDNKSTVEPLRSLEKWGGQTQTKFTAAGGQFWYFHFLQPPFPRVLIVK